METLLYLFLLQAPLGAFDIVYHHEVTERLTWRPSAAKELRLHGLRNGLYVVIFLTLGWFAWQGVLAWLFGLVLLAEVLVTLWDFVVEDRTRDLPASERVTHAVLAIAYGAILACFVPVLAEWAARPTALVAEHRGWLSWAMTVYAAGCAFWAWRDNVRAVRLAGLARAERDNPAQALPGRWSVLVTGGTGFIGKRLCQDLIDAGHDVTVVTRDRRKLRSFRGAIRGVERLADLPDGPCFDAVINLAGEPVANGRWTAAKRREILRSRVESTRALVTWIRCQRLKPRVLVSASAMGYYGYGGTQPFTEESAPRPAFGHDVCAAWEAEAQAAERFEVRVCRLRIGLVLGAEGGALGQMMLPFELGLGGPIGTGRQWMSWIHLDDMVGLIVHAMACDDLRGPINATAPNPVTNRDFARALGRALRRPAVLPLPASIVRLALGQMAEELLLGARKILPRRAEESGYRFRYPGLDTALRQILGAEPMFNETGPKRHSKATEAMKQ